jgi:hypothetical protein
LNRADGACGDDSTATEIVQTVHAADHVGRAALLSGGLCVGHARSATKTGSEDKSRDDGPNEMTMHLRHDPFLSQNND